MGKSILAKIQSYLCAHGVDAWLIYQCVNLNPIFNKIIGTDKKVVTRRAFLLIRQKGAPVLIHSAVDGGFQDLKLKELTYTSYEEFQDLTKKTFGGIKIAAMEYSQSLVHISKVDAGTVDYVRSLGIKVVSSGDLIQIAARLTDSEVDSHLQAAKFLDDSRREVFSRIECILKKGERVSEYDIQQIVLFEIKKTRMETIYEPQTTINENSAKGHYLPAKENGKIFKNGDLLLIDMWARIRGEENIFADITWMLYRGEKIPLRIEKMFTILVTARDMAIEFLRKRVKARQEVMGWEVDKVARDYINSRGYGRYFNHRLGHSLGTFVHGQLANFDNLENKDEREILPNHLSSVEPGIYILGKVGLRTEVDILVTDNDVLVTTEKQDKIYKISC